MDSSTQVYRVHCAFMSFDLVLHRLVEAGGLNIIIRSPGMLVQLTNRVREKGVD